VRDMEERRDAAEKEIGERKKKVGNKKRNEEIEEKKGRVFRWVGREVVR